MNRYSISTCCIFRLYFKHFDFVVWIIKFSLKLQIDSKLNILYWWWCDIFQRSCDRKELAPDRTLEVLPTPEILKLLLMASSWESMVEERPKLLDAACSSAKFPSMPFNLLDHHSKNEIGGNKTRHSQNKIQKANFKIKNAIKEIPKWKAKNWYYSEWYL